jgi:hypothetical protein
MARRSILTLFALILMGFSTPGMARENWLDDLSLSAAFGGALPYSTGNGGYLVTRLLSPGADGGALRVAGQSPFGSEIRKVFDSRPQLGLGGRYRLGTLSSGAKVSLRAMVSAGVEPVEGPRPMVGLAGLSVVF